MFFNGLLKKQNNVHIIKLNVSAQEFAPYEFGISNCPIKIFIYFLFGELWYMKLHSHDKKDLFLLISWHDPNVF